MLNRQATLIKNMHKLEPNIPTTFTNFIDSPNPLILKALKYIREKGAANLPREKVFIDGDSLIFNGLVDAPLKQKNEAFLEAHKKYIDLQIIVEGTESFGIKNIRDCKNVKLPYNPEKDIEFFSDNYSEIATLKSGQIILLPPESAHAPQIGEGSVLKGVFKIKA